MVCEPGVSALVVKGALLLTNGTLDAIIVGPSIKVTVPVGVSVLLRTLTALTVAVKVTAWP